MMQEGNLSKTRHIQARMSLQAINQKLLDLTLEFGVERHDGKIVLNRKGLLSLLDQLASLREAAQKAMNKGGLVVVKDGDVLITTYRLDSYDRALNKDSVVKEAA